MIRVVINFCFNPKHVATLITCQFSSFIDIYVLIQIVFIFSSFRTLGQCGSVESLVDFMVMNMKSTCITYNSPLVDIYNLHLSLNLLRERTFPPL